MMTYPSSLMTRAELVRRYASLRARFVAGELPEWEYKMLRRGAAAVYSEGKSLRRAARRAVQTALESGKLQKPICCSWPGDCSVTVGLGLEGHHSDYSKVLDVSFFCSRHHDQADRQLAQGRPFGVSA